MEQIPSIQDLQYDSQVFDTEHLLNLHTPNISIERTYSPPVVCNDQAFTSFVASIPHHFSLNLNSKI